MAIAVTGCGSERPSPTAGTPGASATPAPTARGLAPRATPSVSPELSPTATATPTEPPISRIAGGTYVALGDSLGVGVGASDPGRLGYVARLSEAVGAGALVNLSVSGETSGSLLGGAQLSAARQAILDADPQATLVTLDIGGNDLLRLIGTEPCTSQPGSAACQQLVAATLAQFEENYRRILAELSETIGPPEAGPALAVMTYFNPFSGTDAAYESAAQVALVGLDGEVDCVAAGRDQRARGMNDIIACVGAEHGAMVADVLPRFEGLGLQLTHIASEDIHANDLGYEVIADVFAEALDVLAPR